MDDLTSKLQSILSSEEGMQQLQNMAEMLGIGGNNSLPENAGAPAESFDFGNLLKSFNPQPPQKEQSALLPESFNPAMLIQLQELLRSVRQDNPGTAFLRSLRPLLKENRRHKIDEAIRLMQLAALLPVLQKSGILKSFGDLLGE